MNLIAWIDTLFGYVSENRMIRAIRQGLIYNMPLILIGSFVILILNMPIAWFNNVMDGIFGDHWRTFGLAIHKGTFRIMSLSTLMAISYALVKERDQTHVKGRNLSPIIVMLTAVACYVVFSPETGMIIDENATGPTGMYSAILMALLSTHLFMFFSEHVPRRKKMYTYDSDAILQNSLDNVIPVLFTISCFALLRVLLDSTDVTSIIHDRMYALSGALFEGNSHIGSALMYCFVTHIMWFFGIHGTNVLENVAQDLFATASDLNIALVASGSEATQVLTKEFFDVFVFPGGAGCTLGLLIALLFAGKYSKTNGIAKYSILPGLFNINEVMIYGLPIIFNPYYLIPFLLSPMVLVISSYIAFATGLVPLTVSRVVWSTPIFVSGYISTASMAGVLLQAINLLLVAAIYLPFVRLHEKMISKNNARNFKAITKEYNSAQPDHPPRMLNRNDEKGIVVRALAGELNMALNGGDVGMYMAFQPKSRGDGKVFGAEALLRWEHSLYGQISPLVILGIAEEADMVIELGAWTMEQSFAQLREWRNRDLDLTLSVNLSPRQIKEDVLLAERVADIIKKYDLDPANMELELTEHAAVDESETTKERMEQMKALGVNISIDDFGMGSSSLLYLRDFHASVVKVDMSLVQTISTNTYNQEIVRSIMSLCQQLHAGVVAEGVENEEQIKILQALGCDQFQGWYFSKALAAFEFSDYVEKNGVAEHQI